MPSVPDGAVNDRAYAQSRRADVGADGHPAAEEVEHATNGEGRVGEAFTQRLMFL
jgi:hypothetical protein